MFAGLLPFALMALPSDVSSPEAPSLAVRMTGQAKICRVEIETRTFHLPRDADKMVSFLRPFSSKGAVVDLAPIDQSLPYRCLGYTIFLVQRAGLRFTPIGFISEPGEDR